MDAKTKKDEHTLIDDAIDVERHIIRRPSGENYYITIGDCHIMSHFANAASAKRAGEYQSLQSVCRLASKLRAHGGTWELVASQIEKAGVGHKTVMSDLADIIRKYDNNRDCIPEEKN